MTQGGGTSSLARSMKERALRKKRRQRKRLRDFLGDDLLRLEMIKEFDEKMGKKECARRIEELQKTASREVTPDDVHVSSNEVEAGAMRRIVAIYAIFAILLLLFLGEGEGLLDLSVALGCHAFDNKLNRSRRVTKWVNWAWLAIWAFLQVFLSYTRAVVIEIPQGFLGILFVVAMVFSSIESITTGVQDSVCGMRPGLELSIMEV